MFSKHGSEKRKPQSVRSYFLSGAVALIGGLFLSLLGIHNIIQPRGLGSTLANDPGYAIALVTGLTAILTGIVLYRCAVTETLDGFALLVARHKTAATTAVEMSGDAGDTMAEVIVLQTHPVALTDAVA